MLIPVLISGILLSQAPQLPLTSTQATEVLKTSDAKTPEHPLLTFAEALDLAEKQSPSIEATRARLQQAGELSAKAWADYLPSITANGTYTRFPRELSFSFPDAPEPIPFQKKNQLAGEVRAQQALLVPTLWPAIQNAYLGERAAGLTAENARRETLFAVARAYLGAASLRESLAVQEQLLDVRRGFERDAKSRYEVGDVERLALLRATLDRKEAEQEVVRGRNAYATAKSALASLIGRPVDFEVIPPRDAAVAIHTEAHDVAAAERAALERRPDAAAARLDVDLAQGTRTQVMLEYLPNLHATANYSLTNAAGLTGQSRTWTAGLALSWTLFDGGLREATLRESSGRIAEARANLRGTEELIRDEVRKARGELETAEANLSTAEERVKLAVESAHLAKESFDAGATTYLQVTDANATLASAQLSVVAESLNVQLSRLALARAMGLFDPTGHSLVKP
ncbi:outer membrane efflux protein domain-containing protein [Myxococcus stipitatus DSM 14675]|uniref:Outer membrane efflux protein domain-containing protein n=1 Tax=Myxococcus stipitatus (strain DSM 14675 / JCM 12634 / Mx s8) TaxID=1278073 RepID=L7UCJ0_MYXSD|nr:TolC family protein [Myxococcus stipitatus]AGC45312.1 outer membrane efflux protein domain-containing protein [Myxococcus stipitatus DSM 14675]